MIGSRAGRRQLFVQQSPELAQLVVVHVRDRVLCAAVRRESGLVRPIQIQIRGEARHERQRHVLV